MKRMNLPGLFLLPEDEFTKDMEEVVAVTNPDAYLDLKRKWKVSCQAMMIRALHLGIIEPQESRNFLAPVLRKKYRYVEPLDDVLLLDRPKKVRTIIEFAAKKGLLDVRSMIETDWKAEVLYFENMTGIDEY